MENYFNFEHKKYLITGASSGIGRAVAVCLSELGATGVLLGRNEMELEKTAARMCGEGHMKISVDLAGDHDLTGVMNQAVQDGKKLDGLIHCAGVAPITPVMSLSRTILEECMGVNFYAFVELVRLYSKRKYRAEKGNVVGISSINSLYPDKCQTLYAASKAALNVAVQAFALELADKNIRINAVVPGAVNTPMTDSAFRLMGGENTGKKLSRQILGLLKPEQVARSVLYLLSDMSDGMTGRLLFTDGGYLDF